MKSTSELENRPAADMQVEALNAMFEKHRVPVSCLVYWFLPSAHSNARYVWDELILCFRRKWTHLWENQSLEKVYSWFLRRRPTWPETRNLASQCLAVSAEGSGWGWGAVHGTPWAAQHTGAMQMRKRSASLCAWLQIAKVFLRHSALISPENKTSN